MKTIVFFISALLLFGCKKTSTPAPTSNAFGLDSNHAYKCTITKVSVSGGTNSFTDSIYFRHSINTNVWSENENATISDIKYLDFTFIAITNDAIE